MGQTVELGIKINVEGNQTAAGNIDQVTDSTTRLGEQTQTVSQSMASAHTNLGNSTAQLTIGQLHFLDSLRDQAAQAGLTKVQLLQLQAAEMGLSDVSAEFIAKIEAASASHAKFSLASAGATRELAVLGREIASGNIDRLAGSMTVLADRTGLLPALFSPVGIAITAVGVAVVGLGIAAYEAVHQQDELQKSLDVTGNMAGLTRDSMNAMANDIQTSATGGVGAATTMLGGLAAAGRFTGGELAAVGHTALEFGELTGQSSEKVQQYFLGMTNGVTDWAYRANQSYHFMDAVQYEHIATLEKEGKSQQAVIEVMHLMDTAMADHKDKVNILTASYRGWVMIIDDVTAAFKRMVVPTIGDQVKSAIAELNELQTKLKESQQNGSMAARTEDLVARVAAQRKKVHDLIEQSNREELAAAKKEEDDRISQRGVAAQRELDQIKQNLMTREQLRAAAEAKIRADAEAVNADAKRRGKGIVETEDEINALVAASDAKYADQTVQAQQVAALKNQDALRQIKLKSLADDISVQYQRGEITKTEFDREMTENAQASNASKQRYEQAVLQIGGLSALERQAHSDSLAQLKAQSQAIEEGGINKWLADQDALYGALSKAIAQNGATELGQLDAAIAKQKLHNAEIGQTAVQKELVTKKINEERLAEDERYAQYLRDMIAGGTLDENQLSVDAALLAVTDQKIAREKALIDLKQQGASLDADVEQKKIDTKQFQDAITAAKTMETELTSSFGNIGTAIGKMSLAFANYGKTQFDVQNRLKAQLDAANGDEVKMQAARDKASQDSAAAQMKQYADIAGAASQFFSKGSKGYQALQDVQKVYRLAEIAMTVESTAKQLWSTATTVAAHVTGESTKSAATVAGTAVQLATDQAKGASAGAVAIVTQGQGDPYTAWVRMAAMAAAVAALGFVVAGGGGSQPDPNSADQVQKSQGTGTVLGDAKKQSDSISASMKLLASNSSAMLPLTSEMASSLKNIEAGISGVANIVAGNASGITTGTNFNVDTSKTHPMQSTAIKLSEVFGAAFGPLGVALGGALGSVVGKLWGSSSSSVTDSGLQIGGSIGQLEQGQGINQYANVQTKSSSWFGLKHSSSDSTQTASAGDAINQQFALIFQGLQATLQAAGADLGKSSTEVGNAVSSFVLDTTKISLKGLTGTALTDAINAVISASMDKVSKSVFPQLTAFQQVGEGYTQTVARVATGIEQAQVALQGFGITAINYTAILDKQGDVGTEIVRQSIDAVETAANGALTGVGKIIQTANGATSDLASLYQSLLSIRTAMNDTALNGQNLSVSMIQGAGGTSQLSQGLSDYFKNYFTPAEQSASEMKDLSAQFAALNVAMPTTKDGFRALVSSIDTNSEAGQKLQGKLLTLSAAFSDAVDHANALTGAVTSNSHATAADTQAQQHALDLQLMQAKGDTAGYTAATRADTLAKLTGDLLVTQEAIYAAQDQSAALAKAQADQAQQHALDLQLMQAQGDTASYTAATRADTLAKLTGNLLTTQEAIYAAQDQSAALAKVQSDQAKQHALDLQLLQAQGDTAAYTAATRADTLATLTGNMLATQEAIYAAEDKAAAVTKATNDLSAAYSAQTSTINGTISSLQSFINSIANFKDSLTLGAQSPLSPLDKYQQSKEIYERTLSAAQHGDQNAQGQLQANATAFLDASKAYNASSAAYSKDFNAVQKDMTNVGNWAKQQVSAAQAQLAVLNAQASSLNTINNSVLSVQQAIANLAAARAMPGTTTVGTAAGGAGTAGAGAAAGSSNFAGALKALQDYTASGVIDPAREFQVDLNYFNAWYANKPNAAVNGSHASGLESVPYDGYIGELHRGEAVIDAPAMAAMRRYFNAPVPSTRSTPVEGGNAEAVAELKQQNEHLSALVRLHSAGYQAVLEKLGVSSNALNDINKKAKLESAR